ncbi:hypothetical protein RRG08_039731 [Elysia crispata]|uniref:Uncharacterized protein n=1 Tax=Elysia crispata TaxID=231223 RepID=A0AAE1CVN9_9GAST|nr:hypothetical protein RRG08_039731 [Elysia crispata]
MCCVFKPLVQGGRINSGAVGDIQVDSGDEISVQSLVILLSLHVELHHPLTRSTTADGAVSQLACSNTKLLGLH